jgi:hypothetical protein
LENLAALALARSITPSISDSPAFAKETKRKNETHFDIDLS